MAGRFVEMRGDLLTGIWLLTVLFLLAVSVRVVVLHIKKQLRRMERERLEREGMVIFHEEIDDISIQGEMKGSFGTVLTIASCFSLIVVVVFPLIVFLQGLIG